MLDINNVFAYKINYRPQYGHRNQELQEILTQKFVATFSFVIMMRQIAALAKIFLFGQFVCV